MMVSLCGVMEMEIYNSKQEIGCRILLILVCTKKKMQAETISVYDYFSVHIDDIFSELPCLHPSRDFVPLIMVNEGRITQKYSPVHRTSPRGNSDLVSWW